jgi:hypothetical protein
VVEAKSVVRRESRREGVCHSRLPHSDGRKSPSRSAHLHRGTLRMLITTISRFLGRKFVHETTCPLWNLDRQSQQSESNRYTRLCPTGRMAAIAIERQIMFLIHTTSTAGLASPRLLCVPRIASIR